MMSTYEREEMTSSMGAKEKVLRVQKEHFTEKWRNPLKRSADKKGGDYPKESKPLEEKQQATSTKKKYERIEDVAGRPIDEILLENLQLRNRRGDMNKHLQQLNDVIAHTKTILLQLIEVEIKRNPTVALAVADEYELRDNSNRSEIPVDVIAACLRKMQYYMSHDVSDWTLLKEEMEIVKREAEKWQEENAQLREEVKKWQTQEKEMKHLSAKGVKLVVRKEEGSSIVPFQQTTKEGEVYQTKKDNQEDVKPTGSKMYHEKEESSFEEVSKNGELTVPETDEHSPSSPKEEEMLEEISKPTYQVLLDRKGYDYRPSKSPTFDIVIEKETGDAVPLIYIDYCISQTEMFDAIMEKTNSIYFLFDSKETMKKGNMKFTSWLLKEKKKKRSIQFSFTTIDELKTRGLDELNSL